jgi:hypothetical protein
MTDWRPITFMEPEGNGTVLVWCSRTDWVTVQGAEAVREGFDGEFHRSDTYEFSHFAYVDHPYPVPGYHPYHELILMTSAGPNEHIMLTKTLGDRAETYQDFVLDEAKRYYCGQADAKTRWMCENEWRFLFKTKEERLLAEIALAGKRA